MEKITPYLPILQIVVSLALVALVLLQPRGSGLGGAFGGGDGTSFATRRGLHQKLYWLTILLGIAFLALAVLNLLL
ncbi:MAG: preprotein translocase subunit SecG [Candidatus Wildermuthbacteria bacterium]|nr:preprotein translocase subunit SecG [Candidatus Wildermuthbacteria bacterium]